MSNLLQADPLPRTKRLPFQQVTPQHHPHGFMTAIMRGDIFVLMTDEHDEDHRLREFVYPVELFYVSKIVHSPKFYWELKSSRGIRSGRTELTRVNDLLSLAVRPPIFLVQKPRGICTVFAVEVAHGYRFHHIDEVKDVYPEIYDQINITALPR